MDIASRVSVAIAANMVSHSSSSYIHTFIMCLLLDKNILVQYKSVTVAKVKLDKTVYVENIGTRKQLVHKIATGC